MSDLLKGPAGDDSSKRWFGALCFVVAVGLAVLGQFSEAGADVDLIKAFLWPATVVLVGGTAAEQIKVLKK